MFAPTLRPMWNAPSILTKIRSSRRRGERNMGVSRALVVCASGEREEILQCGVAKLIDSAGLAKDLPL